jgi:hypothetical protein
MKAHAKPDMPVVETRRNDEVGALEELHGRCQGKLVEAQHGRSLEDAGRASALAWVMTEIRAMQKARS